MNAAPISSGILANKGYFLDIQNDLQNKIKNIIIHNIPLSTSNSMTVLKTIGKITSPLIHSAFTPTLSHIAIQLNLEDSDFIYIIEYGAYFSKDSQEPRKDKYTYDYYYINKDGVRISRLSYNNLESYAAYRILSDFTCSELKVRVNELKTKIISGIIAEELYNKTEYEKNLLEKITNDIYRIECDIKNKITLKELCNNFENENWRAQKYDVITHNSQTFAAEIIKILKAIRMHEADKIRVNEKRILPNCLIKALMNNEDLSLKNTLGRIPIFGLFHDLAYNLTNK